MRHPPLRHWLLCCCLLLVALVAPACDLGKSKPRPLRLGTVIWPGFAPFYVARDLDLYPGPGLDIVVTSTGVDTTHAFLHKRADLIASTLAEAIRFIDQGANLKIPLVLDQSNGGEGIVARHGISSVRDLKGRRVAVEIGTESQYMLIRALSSGGLSTEDVTLVGMPLEECLAALERGEVDAAALWEPLVSEALEKGLSVIFSSKQIPGEIFDVLVVHTDVVEGRIDELAGVLLGWHRAARALRGGERRPEAERSALRYLGMTEESLARSLTEIELTDLDHNRRLFDRSSTEASIWRAYEVTARFMVEHGLVKRPPPDPGAVLDPRIVERALALHKP